MEILFYFFIFIFGTFIGSFLNVLIDRIPRGEDIFVGRSHCENCKKPLGVFDLIPLFSFLFLRGRCRYCKIHLSWFYPLVEIVTGIIFVLVVLDTGIMYQVLSIMSVMEVFYYWFILSSMIVIFFTDLKYGIIPFVIVLPTTVISSLYILLTTSYFIQNLFFAVGAFLFFLLIFLFTRGRGMGFGDVVYVFLMGLLLGFPEIVIGLYIAFLTGALVSLILIVAKRKKLHGGIVPFGPFLVFGTVVSLFWGENIFEGILRYLLI